MGAGLGRAVVFVEAAECLPRFRRLDDGPGPVDQPDVVITRADDDVGRLDVPVEDTIAVGPAEDAERAAHDPDQVPLRKQYDE